MCRELRKAGFTNLSAFDISDENVLASKAHASRVFRSSCEAIAEPDNTYDVVMHVNVIEHVMNVETALKELHRILKPGGVLYLMTDNSWWQTIISIKQLFIPTSKPYSRFEQPIDGDFTTSEMRALLTKAGFKERHFYGIGGIPIGNSVLEKLLRVSAAKLPVLKHFTTRMSFLAQKV